MSDFPEIDAAADVAFEENPGGEIKPGKIAELKRLLPPAEDGQQAA